MSKPTREQMKQWLRELPPQEVATLLESADMTAHDIMLEYLEIKDNDKIPCAQKPVIFWNAIERMMDRVYDIMEDEYKESRLCPRCHGTGGDSEYCCYVCHGTGDRA